MIQMDEDLSAAFHGAIRHFEPRKLDKNATVVPVGLQFRPSFLFINFSPKGGRDYRFTCVHCGQVYKDFYDEALRAKVQPHITSKEFLTPCAPLVATEARASELVKVFAAHIEAARQMGMWTSEYDPKLDFRIIAITVPDHWDTSARTVVARAAKLAGQTLDGSHMILKYSRAVQLAYQMARHSDGTYLTLLVRCNETHLHLMLVQMCGTECKMQGEACLHHLGDEMPLKVVATGKKATDKTGPEEGASSDEPTSTKTTDNEPHKDDPGNDRPAPKFALGTAVAIVNTTSDDDYPKLPAHQHPPEDCKSILESIKEFLILKTQLDTPHPSPLTLKDAASNLKYIFTGGEARHSSRYTIQKGIEELFADMDWIKINEGCIGHCGARGAGVAARRQFQNPQHLGDWKELPEYVRGPEDA